MINILLSGAFPLSEVNLMTEEQRQKFLPAVRKFTELMKKDKIEPEEIQKLVGETKKLDSWKLFPINVGNKNRSNDPDGLSQFEGLGALSGILNLFKILTLK